MNDIVLMIPISFQDKLVLWEEIKEVMMDKAEEMMKRFKGVVVTEGKPIPHIVEFTDWDKELLISLNDVFRKSGLEGRIRQVEFDCGTPPPKPPVPLCIRICIPGPDDRPICTWICR